MNLRKGRNTEKQITCSKQKQNNQLNRGLLLEIRKMWIQFTLDLKALFEPSLARMNCTLVFISGSTQLKIYKTS